MEPVFEIGLTASQWLQTQFPQLEGFFHFISALGLEEFYLAVIPLIYWSLDKRLGKHLGYVFLLSNVVNAIGKHSFRGPRPFWLDDTIGLDVEKSYGVPSGHTQAATAFYLFIAGWLRQKWMWALAIFMVATMGISRIYLGVHFIHDVVVGLLLGLLVLLGYVLWQQFLSEAFSKRILGFRFWLTVLLPITFLVIYVLIRLLIGPVDDTVAWNTFLADAELEGVEGVTTAVASLLGLGVGLMLEGSRVRFRSSGTVAQRIGRYLLGIAITMALWSGLRLAFASAEPLWQALPLRFLRYLLTTLWIAYWAPFVFVRLGLAEADPDPGITMDI